MQLKLHPKQTEVLLSPATEILFGGAAGPGKSHLLRVAAIIWCNDIPGLQVYLLRRTYPELWANHMEGPKSFPALLAPWVRMGKRQTLQRRLVGGMRRNQRHPPQRYKENMAARHTIPHLRVVRMERQSR